MEVSKIKRAAERGFRIGAQFSNAEFANLVAGRLTRPADVAIDFVLDVECGERGVERHVINRLLTRPIERVNASVYNESRRPPHFVEESAEVIVRIFIEPHLNSKSLAVERPTFDERSGIKVLPKLAHAFEFIRKRNLKVMPRHRFMQRERHDLIRRTHVESIRVGIEPSRFAALRTALLVVRSRLRRRHEFRDLTNAIGEAGACRKEFRKMRIHFLTETPIAREQFLGRLAVEARISAQVLDERSKPRIIRQRSTRRIRSTPIRLRNHSEHLRTNARNFGKPNVMNLLRRQRSRRKTPQLKRIPSSAAFHRTRRNALATLRQIVVNEERLKHQHLIRNARDRLVHCLSDCIARLLIHRRRKLRKWRAQSIKRSFTRNANLQRRRLHHQLRRKFPRINTRTQRLFKLQQSPRHTRKSRRVMNKIK